MPRAITRNVHAVMQAAEQDGREVHRIEGRGLINFFLEDDCLVAKVTDAQAALLANVYGFEVEGYPIKEDAFDAPVQDWFAHGEAQYREKEFGKEKEKEASLAEQLVALLGPDAMKKILADAMQGKVQGAVAVVEQHQAAKVQEAVKAEKTRPWILKDVIRFKEQEIKDLLDEYASDVDSAPMHRSAAASVLVKRANANPSLDHKLRTLTGR